MCSYKSLLPQSCSWYSQSASKIRQEFVATSPYCLSPAVGTSQTERRTRQECAAISTYCLSPAVSSHRHREELDRNVQLQVLIDSALHSVLRERDQNQIGMCSYKSLLPQSRSQHSQTERRTRQECAATSTYCLSPDIGTHRDREELDRNVQLRVLIVSALQLVPKDRDKNQIWICSYKYLLIQSCSNYSEREKRTRQECAATSPYCLSPTVSTQRQGEELDRNVQLQVLIASVLQSVLTETESRTRQECAATSPYCLSPAVITQREREELENSQIGMCSQIAVQLLIDLSPERQGVELDINVQLQVLIASALQLVLKDREKNQIGMCSYKYLLPQS